MAIRRRTTKLLAKRHDLDYFKKGSPIRTWQFKLALVALVCAVLWIGISSARSSVAFSSGPISSSHAVFGQKCETCHKPIIAGTGFLPVGFGSSRHVPDSACESCHTVGLHHANQTVANKACSTCHIEHVGAMHLAAAPVSGCTQCHGNLEVRTLPASVATHIDSFTKGHPDFRALRTATPEIREAAFGLKFNHADHLKSGLTGSPNGEKVTLQCSYCHQVEDSAGKDIAHSGRMANVNFERSCQSCHSLDFSTKVEEQAPHVEAAKAFEFVQAKMQEIAPGDKAALVKAETILFREKCSLCHTVGNIDSLPASSITNRINNSGATLRNASFSPSGTPGSSAELQTPTIAPSHAPQRFFTAALFSHTAHNTVQCEECHAAALTSTNGNELLMPNIATCQRCHDGQSRPQGPSLANGHAESGCSLCHEYHETLKAELKTGTGSPMPAAFRIDQLTSR